MKKLIFLIPILGLIMACSGGKKKEKESTDLIQKQTEKIETLTNTIDKAIDSSDTDLKNIQKEIDSLLNDI